jgi:hypothetical protein
MDDFGHQFRVIQSLQREAGTANISRWTAYKHSSREEFEREGINHLKEMSSHLQNSRIRSTMGVLQMTGEIQCLPGFSGPYAISLVICKVIAMNVVFHSKRSAPETHLLPYALKLVGAGDTFAFDRGLDRVANHPSPSEWRESWSY